MAAVMIPVFLLLTALVVDVGNWYTHKRQLQNRADAAAFAAGRRVREELEGVRPDDATVEGDHRAAIADAARQYAGDPEAADYRADASRGDPLHNSEIANQANLDVVINSNDGTTPTTPTTPTAAARRRRGTRASSTRRGRHLRPRPLDGRPRQGARPAVALRRGRLLLSRTARARVEIRPALSGHQFLPLAVPNNVITKVQVRYFDECTGDPIAKLDLADAHPTGRRAPGAAAGGGNALGPPERREGRRPKSSSLSRSRRTAAAGRPTCPSASRSGSRAATRSTSTEHLRAAARHAVRRLLPPALTDPRLERRQPPPTRSGSATST